MDSSNNHIDENYNRYLSFFLSNIEFARQYISIHYPFNYNYLIENWEYLQPGTAHYCVYIADIESVYPSIFGLCYNKNIRWNSKLRAKYDYGFFNPYQGLVDGTGGEPVEQHEVDYLDNMIPLDKKNEMEIRNWIKFNTSTSVEDYMLHEINLENLFFDYDRLSFDEVKSIFDKSKLSFIINESIWNNTMKYVIDEIFCDRIIECLKEKVRQSQIEDDLLKDFITSDDSRSYDNSYRGAYDNPYYNDTLDLDQQNEDFWNEIG